MDDFRLLLDGRLVAGETETDVINPATEQVLARAPRASPTQMDRAVAAARTAFQGWGRSETSERKRLLSAIADVIEANTEPLARLLTQEQGKPLSESRAEVGGMAVFFRYFATLDLASQIIESSKTDLIELHRRPLGVVAAILPWNFPLMLLAFKVAPALLAGNTVVIKPAASTPLATLRFGALVADLLPPGVLNIITDANDLGGQLTAHPDVKKISFTGSSVTGRKVMQSAAATLKRLTLELGGNDAAILLDDADINAIAPSLYQAAFSNAGQVCLAIKRLYVHDSLYDATCDALVSIAKDAIVDDGLKSGVHMGPLQNRVQYAKVRALIEGSRAHGTLLGGGAVSHDRGFFIRPTIVRDITDGAPLVDEEQFGPVLPIIRYFEVDDAIARANASIYGLGASVWSNDVTRARTEAAKLEAGTVWVNRHLDIRPYVSFGGAKQSGIGRELGEAGLEEYSQTQIINAALG